MNDEDGGANFEGIFEGKSQQDLSKAMFEAISWDHASKAHAIFEAGWAYEWIEDPSRMPNSGAARHSAWSPMILAAFEHSEECLRVLIERGAPASEAAIENGLTAIHFAAQWGASDGVDALLAAGADPMARALNGETPLHRAIFSGCEDCARSLLAAGADPSAATKTGETPLESAACEADAELILILISAGADPWLNRANGSETLAALLSRQSGRWGPEGGAVVAAMEAIREKRELSAADPSAPAPSSRRASI